MEADDNEEINVYDDLCDFDLGEEIEKLKAENKRLNEHVISLKGDIEKLTGTIVALKETQNNLTNNISALFLTATAEIERKDRMIEDLRKQVDTIHLSKFNPNYGSKRKDRESNTTVDQKSKKFKYDDSAGRSDSLPKSDHKSNESTSEIACDKSREEDDTRQQFKYRDDEENDNGPGSKPTCHEEGDRNQYKLISIDEEGRQQSKSTHLDGNTKQLKSEHPEKDENIQPRKQRSKSVCSEGENRRSRSRYPDESDNRQRARSTYRDDDNRQRSRSSYRDDDNWQQSRFPYREDDHWRSRSRYPDNRYDRYRCNRYARNWYESWLGFPDDRYRDDGDYDPRYNYEDDRYYDRPRYLNERHGSPSNSQFDGRYNSECIDTYRDWKERRLNRERSEGCDNGDYYDRNSTHRGSKDREEYGDEAERYRSTTQKTIDHCDSGYFGNERRNSWER